MKAEVIKLPCGRDTLVAEEDYERLSTFKWYSIAAAKGSGLVYVTRFVNTGGYWSTHSNKRRTAVKMHRDVLGVTDPKQWVDHINGNGLDNRRSNLRLCTASENLRNSRSHVGSTSTYKGVSWCSNTQRWLCVIRPKPKEKCVYGGYFKSETDAARKYDELAIKYFGEFSRLNFPR